MLCLLSIFDSLIVSPVRDLVAYRKDLSGWFICVIWEKSRLRHLSACLFDSVSGEYKWILFGSVPLWGDTSAFKYDPSKESLADRNIYINFPCPSSCKLHHFSAQAPSRFNPHRDHVKDLHYIQHPGDYSVLDIEEIGWSKVVHKSHCTGSFWVLCVPVTHRSCYCR